MLRLLLPFAVGILTAVTFLGDESVQAYLIAPGVLTLAGLISLILLYRWKAVSGSWRWAQVFGAALQIFLFIAGIELTGLHSGRTDATHYQHVLKEEGLLIGELASIPKIRDRSVSAEVEIVAIRKNGQWLPTHGLTKVSFEKDSVATMLVRGDQVLIKPQLKAIPGPGNPAEFDYREYLSFHLIYEQAWLPSGQWLRLQAPSNLPWQKQSQGLRERLLEVIETYVSEAENQAVASALILGYRDELDAELKQSYAGAGAMHVLAVSGLHVGILYLVIAGLLNLMLPGARGRWFKATLLLAVLWFYAVLTGMSPSVMRAATMFSFIVLGEAMRRKPSIYNTIAASAFFLLMVNPYLLMSPGFQLSYLAVLGIVWMYPRFYKRWSAPNLILDKIWSLLAVSLAAQIATFPLALVYFHQFPNYFLLSNLVVVPAATLVLYGGLLLLVVSPIEAVAALVGKVLDFLLSVLNFGVRWVEALPGAVTRDIAFSPLQCLMVYGIVVSMLVRWEFKKHRALQAALLGVVLLLGTFWYRDFNSEHQQKIVVYSIRNTSAINLIDGRDNILFSSLEPEQTEKQLDWHLRPHWLELGLDREKHLDIRKLGRRHLISNVRQVQNPHVFLKDHFILFHDHRILIWDQDFKLPPEDGPPIEVDYLIFSGNPTPDFDWMESHLKCERMVADASNYLVKVEGWQQELKERGLQLWSVPHQGALVIDLE